MNPKPEKPAMLVVLDGWGVAPPGPDNALSVARTPFFDRISATRPYTTITAHGRRVGLPDDGQMGNSEVGHLNLGAGRVVKQELTRIDDAVASGAFAKNPVFADGLRKIASAGGRAHVMGLCSPGGVHSSMDHLRALVNLISDFGIEVFIHAITDGRDTPPSSARGYLAGLEKDVGEKARIATVVGRYWTMDRDRRWERVEKGYRAHVQGIGTAHGTVDEAVAVAYAEGQTDEFIEPRIIVGNNGKPIGRIDDGDGIFFFNFRADRAREITRALTEDNFDEFDRKVIPDLSAYVCMTEYDAAFDLPAAYPPHTMENIFGQVVSRLGLSQFRCAETEKYAHVTFFFNGGVEAPFPCEDRRLIPSPKDVATYDRKPAMSASAVADAVLRRLDEADDDFILVNFANPDMVGHTGVMEAAVEAAEVVDFQLGRIAEAMLAAGGAVLVTADHGNSEQMVDPGTGQPHTAHTLNPVPVVILDESLGDRDLREGGALEDVAPTLLDLMGLPVPGEMTGRSLLE